ncbi:MAG: M1 family metallopeptidase, partial [Planctomycetota bacterium]
LALTLALVVAAPTHAEIPESSIRYSIEVQLDPETRDITGKETIEWTNTLTEPVTSLPMHLYLNAFSNESSTWFRDTLGARFLQNTILKHFSDPWGWTEPTLIMQGDAELSWQPIAPDDGNHLDRTLIEVELAEPVEPGEIVTLDVTWNGRIPAVAARTGGHTNYFMAAQWFPKVAGVKPEGEFNRHQFFGQTEFFANFADYDVRIGIPQGWAIASSGKGELVESSDGVDWYEYSQLGIVDFAFSIGSNMETFTSTHELATGGEVEIQIFQPKGFEHQVEQWVYATEVSLDVMSTRVMPYPYDNVTVVLPPMAGLRGLGMEYPTFFTGGPGGRVWDDTPAATTRINESIIAHEFAHQYFMGLLATNEFEDAFMDEGMSEYWGNEIIADTWGEGSGAGTLFSRPINAHSTAIRSKPAEQRYPAVWSGPSFLARGFSGGQQFYNRPQATFQTAARLFGQDTVDAIFKAYAEKWSFRHPRVEDFWAVAEETAGTEVAAMLREAYLQPDIPDFKVVELTTKRYRPPQGYSFVDGEQVHVGSERDVEASFGLHEDAMEPDGDIMLEILDPGHTRDERVMGGLFSPVSSNQFVLLFARVMSSGQGSPVAFDVVLNDTM